MKSNKFNTNYNNNKYLNQNYNRTNWKNIGNLKWHKCQIKILLMNRF